MSKKRKHYIEDVFVLCPYYTKEEPITIKCVGLCGSHTANIFENSQEKNEFKEDFCCGLYQNCPLYRGLIEDGK